MNVLSGISNICLFLTALFAVLWYMTSRDSIYETVDGDIVSTKKVFLILCMVSFIAWLAINFNGYL